MSKALKFMGKALKYSAIGGVAATSGLIGLDYYLGSGLDDDSEYFKELPSILKSAPKPPTRSEMLARLGPSIEKKLGKAAEDQPFTAKDTEKKFDVVIVGGGATGAGCALDATLRGLNVLLVERKDFASGTSSKSTKMAHGGVRYLEKAFWELSKAQLDLVIEALNERASIIHNAPHLSAVLPICVPIYKYWQVPYMYMGCVFYDVFAWNQNLRRSYLMGPTATSTAVPSLRADDLVAGVVYHDGTFNDARMNVALISTAVKNGATCLNYTEVDQLLKNGDKVKGVKVTDKETGNQYLVGSEAVINATGPYSDILLDMDADPMGLPPKQPLASPRMVVPSGGVHVMFPDYYCPKNLGLLDPSTSDGRVMFFLPWQGRVLAGTTDTPLKTPPENPIPSEEEVQDILKEIQKYVKFEVRREDVLSAWCGIRPLVRDPKNAPKDGSTQGLVRNHLIHFSDSDLLTISGGKWTTYREMAEQTIDQLLEHLPALKDSKTNVNKCVIKACMTKKYKLLGGETYEGTLAARLAQEYHIQTDLADHLAHNFGDRAGVVLELMQQSDFNKLPVCMAEENHKATYDAFSYPFTVAELLYCLDYEFTRTPVDFLGRRARLAFLDTQAALDALPGVVRVMGDSLGWDDEKRKTMFDESYEFLKHYGVVPNTSPSL